MSFDQQKPFSHPIIEELIQKQWFSESVSEGAKYRQIFNPIPIEIICLVCTVVIVLSYLYLIIYYTNNALGPTCSWRVDGWYIYQEKAWGRVL